MCAQIRRSSTRILEPLILTACALLIAACPPHAIGQAAAPPIPDTAAGHALGSWLAAFNSGDIARIRAFDQAHYPWTTPDGMVALRARTGGYGLLGVDTSGKLWITFHARERSDARVITGKLLVDSHNPELIWALSLTPGDTGSTPTLDATERDRVLERVAKLLDDLYVFPHVGKLMSAALRSAEKRGTYGAITDGQIFAWTLTDDLQVIAHDEHLGVHFSQRALPPLVRARSPEADQAFRQQLLAGNCGFEAVEHLPPDIGYLKFDEFDDLNICAPTAAAAMNFLANSDVLIIDLRDNHGGRGLLQFIASYLFAQPTHLMDTYVRGDHAIAESWTLPHVPGKRFIGKPVFLLTSRQTFSAAEAFCYALKTLKRATLIGETTGGGAHPMQMLRIDEHFSVSVPVASSISPITHTDWEGTGVEPDIRVPAADALAEALRLARGLKSPNS
jgi:Peptidase family S41/N-terminal domain of Peptidase_S41 in eukaryotic IRBP